MYSLILMNVTTNPEGGGGRGILGKKNVEKQERIK